MLRLSCRRILNDTHSLLVPGVSGLRYGNCAYAGCVYFDGVGMTTLRTAAQQALETLDALWQRGVWGDFHNVADNLRAALAEEALQRFTDVNQEIEAALAEPVQAPVGYLPAYELDRLQSGHDGRLRSAKFGASVLDGDVAVYTSPPQRKPPTNQCGETCERAKLCAVCARGLAEPVQEPVAWLWV